MNCFTELILFLELDSWNFPEEDRKDNKDLFYTREKLFSHNIYTSLNSEEKSANKYLTQDTIVPKKADEYPIPNTFQLLVFSWKDTELIIALWR